MWMNEYDVIEAVSAFKPMETPNLAEGARILSNLVAWTDNNSDGWPYWSKPSAAAKRLQERLQTALSERYRGEPVDMTDAELSAAIRPIKAFLTRQGVEHALVLSTGG